MTDPNRTRWLLYWRVKQKTGWGGSASMIFCKVIHFSLFYSYLNLELIRSAQLANRSSRLGFPEFILRTIGSVRSSLLCIATHYMSCFLSLPISNEAPKQFTGRIFVGVRGQIYWTKKQRVLLSSLRDMRTKWFPIWFNNHWIAWSVSMCTIWNLDASLFWR